MTFRLVKLLDPITIVSNVELQATATHLQWRLIGGEWQDLIALTEITGPAGVDGADGKEVEMQKTATHIQWRLTGEAWQDLVALVDITGPQGDAGADGADGADGASAYVYIAYASDDMGTDFTMTFDPALDYIAILSTDVVMVSPPPDASDFAGLWKNYGCDDCLKLDQTTPQTITGGVPLLDSIRVIDSDYQLVDKKYVDDSLPIVDAYEDLEFLDEGITKAVVRYDTLEPKTYEVLDDETLYEVLYVSPIPPTFGEEFSYQLYMSSAPAGAGDLVGQIEISESLEDGIFIPFLTLQLGGFPLSDDLYIALQQNFIGATFSAPFSYSLLNAPAGWITNSAYVVQSLDEVIAVTVVSSGMENINGFLNAYLMYTPGADATEKARLNYYLQPTPFVVYRSGIWEKTGSPATWTLVVGNATYSGKNEVTLP